MTEKVLVLNVKPYTFTDEDSGEVRSGLTVRYIGGLEGVRRGDFYGVDVVKADFPASEFVNVSIVPAYYDIGFSMGANAQQKAVIMHEKLKYNSDLFPSANKKAV